MSELKFRNNLAAAVGFILDKDNSVLVQVKDEGYPWADQYMGFFGGAIEAGETHQQAFEREAEEELGSGRVTDIRYLFASPFVDLKKDGSTVRTGLLYVHAARFQGRPSDIVVKEGAGFAFIAESNLDRFPIVSHNRAAMKEAYKLLREGRIEGYSPAR